MRIQLLPKEFDLNSQKEFNYFKKIQSYSSKQFNFIKNFFKNLLKIIKLFSIIYTKLSEKIKFV